MIAKWVCKRKGHTPRHVLGHLWQCSRCMEVRVGIGPRVEEALMMIHRMGYGPTQDPE